MISEYAIDPACVKKVDDLFRVLAGIGGEHGRLVADFPSGWPRRLLDTAKRIGVAPLEHRRLSRRLDQIRHAIVDMRRTYDDTSAWFTNATECQPRFRAVVSPECAGCPELMPLGMELDECALWSVAREAIVPRKTAKLVETLEPVVRHARTLVLVDPNFSPDTAKWRKPLVGLLSAANQGKTLTRCEFHLRARSPEAVFFSTLGEKVGPELPPGTFVVFVRWKQKQDGEDLHPRYVLTEFGGVRVDFGLDEGNLGEVTDVGLLDRATWERRRADFSVGGTTFEPAGVPVKLARELDGRVVIERLGAQPPVGNAAPVRR
jgi:hypothetical protein